MTGTVLVSLALVVVLPDGVTSDAADLDAYRSAAASAGQDAASQVRLALWCEAHGLSAERLKHLALAVMKDPSNTLARGLMGLVAYQGDWARPEVVGEKIQSSPARQELIREYLRRRARTPDSTDAQMKLAAWCEENGLKDQALAHFSEVIRLDPAREGAWKHLGYKRQGHRWVQPAELAAEKQEAARQKQAEKQWKPKLEKLSRDLQSKDKSKRAKAQQALTEVTDPRAVPLIWSLFVRGNEHQQQAAVRMLGRIDGPSASYGLAALAVFSPWPEVRGLATDVLKGRDPRDVVGRLIAMIHKPFKYQVRPMNGPGSPGELFVDGERFNIDRVYSNELGALLPSRFYTSAVPFDPFSAQNVMMAMLGSQYAFGMANGMGQVFPGAALAAQSGISMTPPIAPQNAAGAAHAIAANPQNAPAILNQLTNDPANRQAYPGFNLMLMAQGMAAQQDLQIGLQLQAIRQATRNLQERLALDVQMIESTNQGINLYNDRALPVLTAVTGMNLGVEPEKWNAWWADQLGYAYQSPTQVTKPTYSDLMVVSDPRDSRFAHSCFAAGTLVQTLDGPRPIELIRMGDQVLSQNPSSGVLSFQPVIATHRNPPARTLRIVAGGEGVVATGIHPFWKAGKGWTMARELKAGDRLRMIGGVTTIESIDAGATQPVYNLDVAADRDFFVGKTGLLVHDVGVVDAVLEPFDRVPAAPSAHAAPR